MTRTRIQTFVCLLAGAMTLCSCGTMKLRQTQYLAVPSGSNTNYYRLRVYARTVLGESDFRSGWFPASAVDSLFGDVSAAGSTAALKTQEDIRKGIDDALKEATGSYLAAAKDGSKSPEELTRLLKAVRAVRMAPNDLLPAIPGGVEMEYNPAENLVLMHSGQKLVFVLSSNPDEVIGAISNFAEQQKTGIEVLRIAETIQRAQEKDVITREAQGEVSVSDDALLYQALNDAATFVDPNSPPTPAEVSAKLESLLALVQAQPRSK